MDDQVLKTWHYLKYGQAPNVIVRWTALGEQGQSMNGIARCPEDLQSIADASGRGWNCYVQLNHAPVGITHRRPHSSDIEVWRHVLIDIDPIEPFNRVDHEDAALIMRYAESALDTIIDAPVIFSGRGMQIWLPLLDNVLPERPDVVSAATRSFLRIISTNVFPRCKVDLLSDLARIARLPGSINQRTGEVATFFHLPEKTTSIPASEIMKFLPKDWEPSAPSPEAIPTDRGWRTAWSHLTARAQTFLESGATKGDRHEAAWHTINKLRQFGVTEESARECVEFAAYKLCDPPLDMQYIERLFTQEYHEKGETL